MQVQDIMTSNPVCAEPSTSLQEVAQMMVDNDCGGIPVCKSGTNMLVGLLTDRDIVCRILAKGLNPLDYTAQDAMTTDLHTILPTASLDDCVQLMERFKVRRVPVTDEEGYIIGIVAQADFARFALQEQPDLAGDFEDALEEISQPKMSM
ncbi:MAG: CBS domain-containing protein [Armatimonadota bacterium]